jgi:hypothetical protein
MRPRADRTEQSAAGIRQFMERLEARVAEINTDPVQRAEHDRESELIDAAERALQAGRAAEARGEYAAAVGFYGQAAEKHWGAAALRVVVCCMK